MLYVCGFVEVSGIWIKGFEQLEKDGQFEVVMACVELNGRYVYWVNLYEAILSLQCVNLRNLR